MADDEAAPVVSGVWPTWVDQWVLPYVSESGLWPVLVALLGHVVIVIAPVLLELTRGNPAMALPLTAMVMASLWLIRTEWAGYGRPRGVSLVVLLTWLASGVVAWWGDRSGLL